MIKTVRRSEDPVKQTWKLNGLFETESEWEKELELVQDVEHSQLIS